MAVASVDSTTDLSQTTLAPTTSVPLADAEAVAPAALTDTAVPTLDPSDTPSLIGSTSESCRGADGAAFGLASVAASPLAVLDVGTPYTVRSVVVILRKYSMLQR